MIRLALDTSTAICSVALQYDGKIVDRQQTADKQHTQLILPMIHTLLKRADVELGDIEQIVYGAGPGSFTGVRIALAVAQGLALTREIPLLGVSSLAMMAKSLIDVCDLDRIAIAQDARMGEVYFASFAREDGKLRYLQRDTLSSPAGIVLPDQDCIVAGTAWQVFPELQERHISPTTIVVENVYPYARDALRLDELYPAASAVAPANAQALYLRDTVAKTAKSHAP